MYVYLHVIFLSLHILLSLNLLLSKVGIALKPRTATVVRNLENRPRSSHSSLSRRIPTTICVSKVSPSADHCKRF